MSSDPTPIAADTASAATEEKKEEGFVLTDLLGKKAVTPTGEAISIETEWSNGRKDVIAFYFSAHWCPPCRQFTPKLAQAYKEYRERNPDDNFEIVFVSWDSDQEAFKEYHGEMTFPALDYRDSRGTIQEALDEKFRVQGIPALVVMDANTGERLDHIEEDEDEEGTTKNEKMWALSPRDMITHYGSMALPLSKETAQKCEDSQKQQQFQALQTIRQIANALLPPTTDDAICNGETYTFSELMDTYQCVGLMLGSKLALENLPQIRKVTTETNMGETGSPCKKVAIVFVPNCFPELDQYAEKPYQEENIKGLFHFKEAPSQDIIDLLKQTAGRTRFDTLVILRQTTRMVEECGMDGICTSKEVKEAELVAVDEMAGQTTKHGASFFPWDKAQIERAEAEDKARAAETLGKMKESLETFLVRLASEGKIVIGDKKDALAVSDRLKELDDEEGLVMLYFGGPNPKLVDCFENVNKELTKNGKKRLEIVFVSRYQKKVDFDEHYGAMVTSDTKTHFMAIDFPHSFLNRAIIGAFKSLDEYTSLVLMKKDGTVVSTNYETADHINFTGHWGFPWNEEGVARGEKKIKALVKEDDERCEQIQKEMGFPVIRRMVGNGNNVKHIPEERIIRNYHYEFLTFGMQDTVVTSGSESNYKACLEAGVFYYEIELLKVGFCTQFGFSSPGALDELVAKQSRGQGNGDFKDSWGVCGFRGELWTHNKPNSWSCPRWNEGDVIGMAVNVGVGKIAVSVNGSEFAAVFEDDAIKSKGVFPCFSFGHDFELRVNTTHDTFKHDGPAAELWLLSPAASKANE